MSRVEVVRAIAIGALLIAATGCGGGGGSNSDDGEIPESPAAAIPLPDIERATLKTFTRENSQQALSLAANLLAFVDESSPYPSVSDSQVNAVSTKSRQQHELRSGMRVTRAPVDVSTEICLSGQATGEEQSPTKVAVRFTNCDVGDAVYNGVMLYEEIDPLPASIALYEITTFEALRVTSTDESLDVVLDGKVEVLLSNILSGDEGESGTIKASLDMRDLLERTGVSLRNYDAGFRLVADPRGGFAADFVARSGTIYDENNEYFSLSAVDQGNGASMFLTSNIIQYQPLQYAIRYLMNTYPEKVTLGLHGLDSDLYVYEDASSDSARLQLDVQPDICGPIGVTGNFQGMPYPLAFPSVPACYLRVDLDELMVTQTNDVAPVIDLAGINTTVRPGLYDGQYFVIPHLDVTDADQQFVSISWNLVSKPQGSAPMYFSWNDGFLFASQVEGVYEFRITASDGLHSTEQILMITVTY